MSIKMALVTGLMAAGCKVHDIGLCMSPMAYFAQFALDVPCVAMVTASHNDNGWTGVKMGAARPVTFGPEEMGKLRDIVLAADFDLVGGGSYEFVPDFPATYLDDLTDRPKHQAQAESHRRLRQRHGRRLRAAGAGAHRLRGHPARCRARPFLPALQPQPRRHADAACHGKVLEAHGADVALGFDGDGDRCGVVDNEGKEIFADKIGVMLARDISAASIPARTFVVDVKSTGLFNTDPEVQPLGAKTDYWKTGHSYIKRRVAILARSPASRSPAISSSIRRSGAAMMTASSPRSPCSTCSTAIRQVDGRSLCARCQRPGARRPCRHNAPTR
jgi:phosphomannomutase/phosphoglucomutase